MNTTYLLIMFAVIALGVWGLIKGEELSTVFGLIVGGFIFVFSFVLPVGDTNYVKVSNFTLEKTPYRIIVTVDNSDFNVSKEFKEATYVNRASEIKSVTVKIPHNAWGIELTNAISVKPDLP